MDIKLPMILIGDGTLIKYKTIEDAHMDLEAYDIDNYSVYDSNCRRVKLYKKSKYNDIGFVIENPTPMCEQLKKEIKEYAKYYELNQFSSDSIDELVKMIPYYELQYTPIWQKVKRLWSKGGTSKELGF